MPKKPLGKGDLQKKRNERDIPHLVQEMAPGDKECFFK